MNILTKNEAKKHQKEATLEASLHTSPSKNSVTYSSSMSQWAQVASRLLC